LMLTLCMHEKDAALHIRGTRTWRTASRFESGG
jgi:hypothetical protein